MAIDDRQDRPKRASETREARLAKALRDNLRRRKGSKSTEDVAVRDPEPPEGQDD